VKFGLSYNTGAHGVDPDAMIAVARHAEDCGFESFYLPEHVALYPGASFGAVTLPADLPIADPLECLAFVAAATAPTPAASPSPAGRSRSGDRST
jgi:alkanesulfonate monooxygenase SsuD/methylene tetrahydromethanopterin reductase-like flavin-dependent oxidoreductase (luciferase family)